MKYCICLITTILCSIVGYADDAVRLSWDGGEQTFKYIEDAIDTSNELNVPTVLTLIDDIDDPAQLIVTNSMTIDLNGHYISSRAAHPSSAAMEKALFPSLTAHQTRRNTSTWRSTCQAIWTRYL